MTLRNEVRTAVASAQSELSFSSPSSLLLFIIACILFIAARLWRLTGPCLWFDEIFSVHAARHAWADMVRFVAADLIHPPLFYALLKIWIGIGGESLLWLRLFPALINIATIVPFVLLSRQLKLKPGDITLALLLMGVNGYLIKYAQELRMYTLLLFFSTCSLWLFVKFLHAEVTTKKGLLLLVIVNLLLVYTHYAGWLVVGLQCVWLVIWRHGKLRGFLLTVLALVLAYVPWIYAVVNAARTTEGRKGLAQNIGWVSRPRFIDTAQYFTLLNRPFWFRQSTLDVPYDRLSAVLALVLIGVPIFVFLWRTFRHSLTEDKKRREVLPGLILFSVGPFLIVFLLSWILPYSVWGTRHLIIAAVPYSMVAALALRSLRPYWIRITVFMVLGCWFVLAGALFLLIRPSPFIWCAWDQLAQQAAVIEPDSTQVVSVYAFEDLVAYHLWFSLDKPANSKFKVTLIQGVPGIINDSAYFMPRNFSDVAVKTEPVLNGDHIWIAFRAAQLDENLPPLHLVKGMGYQTGRVLSTRAQGQLAFLVELRRTRPLR